MRRRMMMGRGLPYDAEIEYIESTGTQYINLLKTINSATDNIVVEFMLTKIPTNTRGFFGARLGASAKNFSIGLASSSYIFADVNNTTYSSYRATAGQNGINKRCVVNLSRSERKITINGMVTSRNTTVIPSDFETNIAYLFAINGLSDICEKARFYSLEWKRNNQMYINLISVRVGQVGYLYDKVSGELFGNAGTGAFIIGPDKMGGVIKWLIINTLHGLSNPSLEERRVV